MELPRVLVLVLSCPRSPYDALRVAQERTWDLVQVEGVETRYYDCPDLRDALRCLWRALYFARQARSDLPDLVFRTNVSSYVDKARLRARGGELPRERCYSGVDGGGFASGSGFFLSRDLVEVLHGVLPRVWDKEGVEDVVLGRALAREGVQVLPGARRYDYWERRHLLQFQNLSENADDEEVRVAYHVRCKGGGVDRGEDVRAMERVHAVKMGGRIDSV